MSAKSNAGYIKDVVFESSYVARQRPAHLSYIAASAGFVPPDPSANYAYLELGCSIGATLNGLAASNPQARFVGIDFNRDHLEIARSDAEASSLDNVEYIEASFEDAVDLDLPGFDYVATNGTYSWLDSSAESAVHAILQRHLRDGGLFYVDYMSLPGKAPISPVWYLMRALTRTNEDGSEARVTRGMELLNVLDGADAGFFTKNPHAREVLNHWERNVAAHPARVRLLAHNALAENWQPYYFTQIAQTMQSLGLEFAGSTVLMQNDIELALPASMRDEFTGSQDTAHMELVKDFFHYTQQRHDVFVKAGAKDTAGALDYLSEKLHLIIVGDWRSASWGFADPEKVQIEVDSVQIEDILAAVAAGASSIAEMKGNQRTSGYTPQQMAPVVSKLLTKPNVELLADKPVKPVADGTGALRTRNDFTANAVEKVTRQGGNMRVACSNLGGCLEYPPLAAAVIAAFISSGTGTLEPGAVAEFVRRTPQEFTIGETRVPARDIDERTVTAIYQQAQRNALPNLIRLGALTDR